MLDGGAQAALELHGQGDAPQEAVKSRSTNRNGTRSDASEAMSHVSFPASVDFPAPGSPSSTVRRPGAVREETARSGDRVGRTYSSSYGTERLTPMWGNRISPCIAAMRARSWPA